MPGGGCLRAGELAEQNERPGLQSFNEEGVKLGLEKGG